MQTICARAVCACCKSRASPAWSIATVQITLVSGISLLLLIMLRQAAIVWHLLRKFSLPKANPLATFGPGCQCCRPNEAAGPARGGAPDTTCNEGDQVRGCAVLRAPGWGGTFP